MDVQWFPYEPKAWLISEVQDDWKHEKSGKSELKTQDQKKYVLSDDIILGNECTNRIAKKINKCAKNKGKLYVMGHGLGAKEGRPIAGNEFIAKQDPVSGEIIKTSYVMLGNVILEAIDCKTPLTIYLYMCFGAGDEKRFGPRLKKYLNTKGHIYVKIYGSKDELNASSMSVLGGRGYGISVNDKDAFEECLVHG